MNTTTIQSRAGRWATVAVVAGIAAGFPSAAIAGPQPVGNPANTIRADHRPSSTIDDEYRKTVNHRPSGSTDIAIPEGRPCFIIQPHWNPAYDGFVPVCGSPGEQPVAEQVACATPIDPRFVGVPWVPRAGTGCESRDRWWITVEGQGAGR